MLEQSNVKSVKYFHFEIFSLYQTALFSLSNVCLIRPTHLIESHVSGILVKKVVTDEGEVIPYYMKSIDFGVELDGSEDFFQMFWPVTVSHRITENSELYELSARDISCRSVVRSGQKGGVEQNSPAKLCC